MEEMNPLQKVKRILVKSTVNICDNVDPGQLLLIMQSEEALEPEDVELIQSKGIRRKQLAELLRILMRKPTESYDAFMDALLEIKRRDIYKLIQDIEREVGYTRHVTGGSSSAGTSAQSSGIHSITSTAAATLQTTSAAADTLQTTLEASLSLEDTQRHIIAGSWEMVREFGKQDGPGKLAGAYHMSLSPDGDVVIADNGASQIKIYSIDGGYKSNIHHHGQPLQIAVSSDNTCFMTDLSQQITMYELSGKYKGSWVSSCPASSYVPELYGLAKDHAGDLLLGDAENKYIYKHHQNGTHVASIKVGIEPRCIAVTSQGTIVITDWYTAPQVISNTGQVLHTLKPPTEEDWSGYYTHNVYCHAGFIFVCRLGYILCYSESGKCVGSMPIPDIQPLDEIAMTSDSKTLLVCGSKSVKVYTTP